PLLAGAEAAAAAVHLEREPGAVLVEPVIQRRPAPIAAVGRSGVEEVYGVPYCDVGCDVCFNGCWIHHFSPLFTAIRRRPYQPTVSLSIPLPQHVGHLSRPRRALDAGCSSRGLSQL